LNLAILVVVTADCGKRILKGCELNIIMRAIAVYVKDAANPDIPDIIRLNYP
jgi:hypothetical protein